MSSARTYEEVIEFLAAGTTPDALAAFHPSEEARGRAASLVEREKTTGLSPDDRSEPDHGRQLEHLMRLARARRHPGRP